MLPTTADDVLLEGFVQVTLCLFTWEDLQQGTVSGKVRLDPGQHRTGDVWHVFLEDLPDDLLYGYSLSGPGGEASILIKA